MLTHKPQKNLIILAISSRIYVEAAIAAGFSVIAIDAFIDTDTRRLAKKSYRVEIEDGQLHSQQVLAVLASLDLTNVMGICYGAGVESQPDFLTELGNYLPLLGNPAHVVKRCKAPDIFYSICKSLQIPTPETSLKPPENPAGWLQKKIGGSGGVHITPASRPIKNNKKNSATYYQKFQEGTSFSCLFFAGYHFVKIIGFNEQWVNKNAFGAFCYGGAVSHAEVAAEIKQQLPIYLEKLCQQFELKGLNSCDFIYNANTVYLLEINPRLSASLDLYENQQSALMRSHLQIFENPKVSDNPDIFEKALSQPVKLPLSSSKAHQVVYAQTDTMINNTSSWPDWVSDVPAPDTRVIVGAPICMVNAVAASPQAAKKLLQQRLATFNF